MGGGDRGVSGGWEGEIEVCQEGGEGEIEVCQEGGKGR